MNICDFQLRRLRSCAFSFRSNDNLKTIASYRYMRTYRPHLLCRGERGGGILVETSVGHHQQKKSKRFGEIKRALEPVNNSKIFAGATAFWKTGCFLRLRCRHPELVIAAKSVENWFRGKSTPQHPATLLVQPEIGAVCIVDVSGTP